MSGRNLLPPGITFLQDNDSVTVAHLVRLELPQSTPQARAYAYVTDAPHNVTYDGKIYKGDRILSIGAITQTTGISSFKLNISVVGEFQEELDRALAGFESGESYLNRNISVRRAFLDIDGSIISMDKDDNGPMQFFEGKITNIDVSENIDSGSVVKWSCASHFSDFETVQGRSTEPEAHNASTKSPAFAYDKGFKHAVGSINVLAEYQALEKAYKLKKSSSWFGLKKNFKLVPYEEEVTKEVDLSINLSGRYLPVIYGTQKVSAIPIMVDTPKNDPSTVYAAYALCEGEIEGILDLIVNGKSTVCVNGDDGDARVCIGNQKNGTTINAWNHIPSGLSTTAPSKHGTKYTIEDDHGSFELWVYHGLPNQHFNASLYEEGDPELSLGLANDTLAPINNHPLYQQAHSQVKFYRQAASDTGEDYWGKNAWLCNTAYFVVRMKLDGVDGGRTELPEFQAIVRGKKVRVYEDINTFSEDKTSTNPAWQLLDYMTSTIYGPELPFSYLRVQNLLQVASAYDSIDNSYESNWVNYWRYVGWDSQGSDVPGEEEFSNRQLMQMNTLLEGDSTVFSNLEAMLTQCDSSLNWNGGKYEITIDTLKSSKYSIKLSDVIGSINVKDETSRNKFNTVAASIIDPVDSWNKKEITFYNSNYLTEDNNVEKKGKISFPFILNYYTGRTWAARQLDKSRGSRSISFRLPHKYSDIVINDVLDITYSRFGWSNKPIVVDKIILNYDATLTVTCKELVSSAYTAPTQSEIPLPDVPTGNRRPVTPTGLNIDTTGVDYITYPEFMGNLEWSYLTGKEDIAYFLVYWVGTSFSTVEHTVLYDSSKGSYSYRLENIPTGEYTFFVEAVSYTGVRSPKASIRATIGDGTIILDKVEDFRVDPNTLDEDGNWYGANLELLWTGLPSVTIPEGIINPVYYEVRFFDKNTEELVDSVNVGLATSYTWDYTANRAAYLTKEGNIGYYRNLKVGILGFGQINGQGTLYQSTEWSYIL